MIQMSLPLIGITTGTSPGSLNFPELYSGSLKQAGGKSAFLSPDQDVLHLAETYDGILVPGGRDLPSIGSFVEHEHTAEQEDPVRINFEISLLHEIIKKRKPVFGICYGMQLINIFFQGTLYQDIILQVPRSLHHGKGRHTIDVKTNPYIEKGEYLVESSHHQSVQQSGKGLIPFAFTADGLIEAVYHADHTFVLGVQWHPERMDSVLSTQLFKAFVAAAGE
jgi:putative glutamine amidotransferase